MPIYPKDFIEGFNPRGGHGQCFVLMPFARAFDDVYDSIRSACESPNVFLACRRADDFYGPGHIMEDILGGIMEADYVVADLTGRNPNVFYELGIAHATKDASRVVIVTQSLEDVPFDLRHMRCIVYRSDLPGLRRLSRDLERALLQEYGNLYRLVAREGQPLHFGERLTGENRDFYRFTLDQLHMSRGSVKFKVEVDRESLDRGNATVDRQYHYMEEGWSIPIHSTDWELRLDRTAGPEAYFTVKRSDT